MVTTFEFSDGLASAIPAGRESLDIVEGQIEPGVIVWGWRVMISRELATNEPNKAELFKVT